MTHLLLVRHGQTDWNLQGRYQGQSDPPLNETGRSQARELAASLAGKTIEAIYASDLQRASETAQILAQWLDLTVKTDRRLREINQGDWEGMLFSDITTRYQQEWSARQKDRLSFRPPGGESLLEVAGRARIAADDISAGHPSGPVLIVAHGLILATLLCAARGQPLEQAYSLIPENARIEEIDWPPR